MAGLCRTFSYRFAVTPMENKIKRRFFTKIKIPPSNLSLHPCLQISNYSDVCSVSTVCRMCGFINFQKHEVPNAQLNSVPPQLADDLHMVVNFG